MQVIPKR